MWWFSPSGGVGREPGRGGLRRRAGAGAGDLPALRPRGLRGGDDRAAAGGAGRHRRGDRRRGRDGAGLCGGPDRRAGADGGAGADRGGDGDAGGAGLQCQPLCRRAGDGRRAGGLRGRAGARRDRGAGGGAGGLSGDARRRARHHPLHRQQGGAGAGDRRRVAGADRGQVGVARAGARDRAGAGGGGNSSCDDHRLRLDQARRALRSRRDRRELLDGAPRAARQPGPPNTCSEECHDGTTAQGGRARRRPDRPGGAFRERRQGAQRRALRHLRRGGGSGHAHGDGARCGAGLYRL